MNNYSYIQMKGNRFMEENLECEVISVNEEKVKEIKSKLWQMKQYLI